jgi:hypothetical protein
MRALIDVVSTIDAGLARSNALISLLVSGSSTPCGAPDNSPAY